VCEYVCGFVNVKNVRLLVSMIVCACVCVCACVLCVGFVYLRVCVCA